MTIDQIRALGGGARQYSVTGGNPLASVHQVDVAPFIQDDWKLKPNLTVSLGLRFELQTNISDHHDVAPPPGISVGHRPFLGKRTASQDSASSGRGDIL